MKSILVVVAVIVLTLVCNECAAVDLKGTWRFNYYYHGHTYTHNMVITDFNHCEFKGYGWQSDNPAKTWDVSGSVPGCGWGVEYLEVKFHIDYTGEDPDYWVDAVGRFLDENFMSGTAEAPGQSAEWDAARIS
jgi:hypothetical protein